MNTIVFRVAKSY